MMLNLSDPINRDHPDNAGLRFCMLARPEWTSGAVWADVVGDTLSTLQAGSAGVSPNWLANRLVVNGGNYITLPLVDFSGSGSIVWESIAYGSYNDGSVRSWWGQSTGGSAPEFSAQKFADNNYYVGFNGAAGDQRVTLAATPATYPTGSLMRYAFTWINGGVSRLYANGVLIGSNGGTTTAVNIGYVFNYGRQGMIYAANFSGALGEFKVYTVALSAEAVARDYFWARDSQDLVERDPRLNTFGRRLWSLPTVAAGLYTPAFQPGFWGVVA